MSDNCFTYGSLMCADIMSRVSGMALAGEPASLAGHARQPVADEDYPGVTADPAASVEGILYRGLDGSALARLDAFEGEMYERVRVQVNLVGGGSVAAWCYIFRAPYRHRLLLGDWSFEAFLAGGKARFLARYMGFAALEQDK
ncbi:MAG: gamma-glutamylcyclotransferase [Gallionellaceae bacterium]|nr:gamma-glutamylcyclotransferase [Gallionellaceae bacterium]